MRKAMMLLTAVICVSVAAVVSMARQSAEPTSSTTSSFQIATEDKNPWTSLAPNVAPGQFQFAIVSDRTGGHRKGVFSRAVQQVNLLQPEFVMSVGDLIEGSSQVEVNQSQWDDFDRYAKQFQMPFFYCPGNHDFGNAARNSVWKERLGRSYYHFVYQNCLFLVLNSNDALPKGPRQAIGKEQLAYIEKALEDNRKVRWTFVFIHHPVWAARDLTENGWLEVEQLLQGRKHNVFCGHVHIFRKYLRNGNSYYQLATTGGGSAMRGAEFGEFDQIAWVTMKQNEPIIAQVGLNGIMKDDLSTIKTDEDGSILQSTPGLSEVVGTVRLKGQPGQKLLVQFHEIGSKPEEVPLVLGRLRSSTGIGLVDDEGNYKAFLFRGSAGLRPGRYAVTFAPAPGLVIDPKEIDNPVPEKYRATNTTPYRIEVKADIRNKFDFDLDE